MSLTATTQSTHSRWREFLSGCRDEAPILLGTMPFGMIYGVLALGAGLPVLEAQAMSSVVFAGSAQFIATQLIREGTPPAVIVLTVFVVNLRHALYSASVAPYIKHLSGGWKVLLAYLLTDEAYAVVITRYNRDDGLQATERGAMPFRHWYFLGAAFTLWWSWQLSTAIGLFLGAQVPASWSLDFTLALTFIALVFPALKDRAGAASAIAAGLVAVLAYGLPYKLGLMLAAITGIVVGLVVEANKK
ncbi:MAG: AzlC family ABC transporter permease [Anaerolineales bacterium]